MNDQKLINKILNLSLYDFSNNFTSWLSITGLHAIIISILFCGLCYVTSDYAVAYWGWAPNIIFDWTTKFYSLILKDIPSWMLGVTSLALMVGMLLLPLVVIQNALDLAFDSSMSGFSITGPIFSYIGAMLLCNAVVLFFMQFVSCVAIFAMLYLMQTSLAMNAFVVQSCMLLMSCLVLYFMQLTYLLSMHILEYKKGIWQSCKELSLIISGKLFFLCKILLIQVLIAACVLTMLYLCLGVIISIIMPIIVWFLDVLRLDIQPILIQMMYNFFYVWAYVLLYAWICLVLAHVYRQLVCPPVDNVACPSCTSCEK